MIQVAVIGFGLSAQSFHLPYLIANKQFKLVAISTSKRQLAEGELAGVTVYADAEKLIEQSTAELIVVTSPNDTHVPLCCAALRAGKHVVLEKPIALSVADTKQLASTQAQSNKHIFPFHNRRWDGDFKTIQGLVEAGALGNIRLFESYFSRYRPEVSHKWKEQAGQGTGFWNDIGASLLDQVVSLFGMPNKLTAVLRNQRPGAQANDYFNVQLHYPETEVILRGSNYNAGPANRFYLEGDKASFAKLGMDPQETMVNTDIEIGSTQWGHEALAHHGTLYLPDGQTETIATEAGSYQDFYQAVARSLLHGEEFPISLEFAADITKLLALANESARLEKTLTLRRYRD